MGVPGYPIHPPAIPDVSIFRDTLGVSRQWLLLLSSVVGGLCKKLYDTPLSLKWTQFILIGVGPHEVLGMR